MAVAAQLQAAPQGSDSDGSDDVGPVSTEELLAAECKWYEARLAALTAEVELTAAASVARGRLARFLCKLDRALQRAKHRPDYENVAQWLKWAIANSPGWQTSGTFDRVNFRTQAPEDEPSESEGGDEDDGSEQDYAVQRKRPRSRYIQDEADVESEGEESTPASESADDSSSDDADE